MTVNAISAFNITVYCYTPRKSKYSTQALALCPQLAEQSRLFSFYLKKAATLSVADGTR